MQTKHIFVRKTHLLRTLRLLLAKIAPKEGSSGGCWVGSVERNKWGDHTYHLRGAPVGGPAPIQMSPVLDKAANAEGSLGLSRAFSRFR